MTNDELSAIDARLARGHTPRLTRRACYAISLLQRRARAGETFCAFCFVDVACPLCSYRRLGTPGARARRGETFAASDVRHRRQGAPQLATCPHLGAWCAPGLPRSWPRKKG
jgi:hypothetical protein